MNKIVIDELREPLPSRRKSVTWKARVDNTAVFFTIGHYEDDRPGELFIDVSKEGSAVRDWTRQTAQLFSIHLQRKMPLETIIEFFLNSRSSPCGRVEHDDSWGFKIEYCTSIMDLIARVFAVVYINQSHLAAAAKENG